MEISKPETGDLSTLQPPPPARGQYPEPTQEQMSAWMNGSSSQQPPEPPGSETMKTTLDSIFSMVDEALKA